MIYCIIVALACLTLGLYAGKRRARGEDWWRILCDLIYDLFGAIRAVVVRLMDPFRADPVVKASDGKTE